MDTGGEDKGYIVMPMGLTIEQREVYVYLYNQCNFKDMTCKYTISQIVAASDKRLNITTMKVRTIMKFFVAKGYVTEIKKGSKGNPSVLKIITIKQQLNNKYLSIKNEDISHLQEINSNKVANIYQLNSYPIKEKEKENNIYSDFERIILKKYPGRKIKSTRDKKVPKLLKEYSVEELTRCIERYSNECKGKNKQYILNESTFWNGRYIDYLDSNYTNDEEVKPIKNNITNWD